MPAAAPPLADAFTSPDLKRRYVRRLFATIADRYDFITRVLSFGRDQSWKRRLIDLAGVKPGWVVLDLACGTGDIAFEAVRRGATTVGMDITLRMLELAARRPESSPRSMWAAADMTALPAASGAFDVVTTGYGLRNVPDLPRAIAEIHRVLRPGGVLGSLDFNRPDAAWLRSVYLAYLTIVGAALGWLLHRDPDTYRYIPASIRRYPGGAGVARMLADAGFTDVQHVPVFGGFMSIHLARRDSTEAGPSGSAVRPGLKTRPSRNPALQPNLGYDPPDGHRRASEADSAGAR